MKKIYDIVARTAVGIALLFIFIAMSAVIGEILTRYWHAIVWILGGSAVLSICHFLGDAFLDAIGRGGR